MVRKANMFSKDNWSRRKLLKQGSAFVAGGSALAYFRAEQLKDKYGFHSYEGVPDQWIEDPEFYKHIEKVYDSDVEMLDPGYIHPRI